MSRSRVFLGKFRIAEVEGTDNYEVSMMPMSDEEIDQLAGIVRCKDCKQFHPDQTDHEYRDPWYCERWKTDRVDPDGFCAWGERMEDA